MTFFKQMGGADTAEAANDSMLANGYASTLPLSRRLATIYTPHPPLPLRSWLPARASFDPVSKIRWCAQYAQFCKYQGAKHSRDSGVLFFFPCLCLLRNRRCDPSHMPQILEDIITQLEGQVSRYNPTANRARFLCRSPVAFRDAFSGCASK